jgi:asparagine synthase (glutamine-hydrolysing)
VSAHPGNGTTTTPDLSGGIVCGIAGFVDGRTPNADALRSAVEKMTEVLRHRGPDDAGCWIDETSGVALGHRRLAIVDLSQQGHQPMTSRSGRYVLDYNGEIYNFPELRKEIGELGEPIRGTGDTEVLLAAIDLWGLRDALARCNGMFALALWDRQESTLSFARDRMGEKPLYYGWAGRTLLFGSELKALRAHPDFNGRIDRGALTLFFRHNCVPGPYSIFEGIRKLPPGTTLTLPVDATPGVLPEPEPYWSLHEVVDGRADIRFNGTEDDALDELDMLLRDAVGLRLHADVPLGAFLSGGIDSSLVVALMQAQSSLKVKTFTIAFEDAGYNEATDAQQVASHLHTDHTELLVTHDDVLGTVPRLAELYDEPFSDSSQIPTFLLSQLTRRHVTVALSGDGGDELFGGYNRYLWAQGMWNSVHRVPRLVRAGIGDLVGAVPPRWWDSAFRRAGPVLPSRLQVRTPGTKMQKIGDVLGSRGVADMHLRLASHLRDPAAVVVGGFEPPSLLTSPDRWPSGLSPVEFMMYLDTLTYLPDDILVKVDRASMGTSLEARVPYLDHRVVAWAWGVPAELRISSGKGKWLLRRLLHRYVPESLVERPKMGFGPPIGSWLRGPLREWAEELLGAARLRREGYLDPAEVRRMWQDHLSGRRDRQYELWDVLMFQVWLESDPVTAATAHP